MECSLPGKSAGRAIIEGGRISFESTAETLSPGNQ